MCPVWVRTYLQSRGRAPPISVRTHVRAAPPGTRERPLPRAPRRCPRLGCDERVPCPHHGGPWAGSTRRATLPREWPALVALVLTRDPVCTLHYPGTWHTTHGPTTCTRTSTEVDHVGDRLDHNPANLRGVCHECHARRTAEQSAAARRPPGRPPPLSVQTGTTQGKLVTIGDTPNTRTPVQRPPRSHPPGPQNPRPLGLHIPLCTGSARPPWWPQLSRYADPVSRQTATPRRSRHACRARGRRGLPVARRETPTTRGGAPAPRR